MEVRWFEQASTEVPAHDDWLSEREREVLAGMRIPKRRCDWRLGRWTTKLAVAKYLASDPANLTRIEVRPVASGAPEAFLDGQPASVSISLSHSNGRAACAVVPPDAVVGCDLELVEPRSDAFVADYFTPEERAIIAQSPSQERDRVVTTIWSAKESALKALRCGLRWDTRSVSVQFGDGSPDAIQTSDRTPVGLPPASRVIGLWSPLRVRYAENQFFSGWWQCGDEFVRTLIVLPSAGPPIALAQSELLAWLRPVA